MYEIGSTNPGTSHWADKIIKEATRVLRESILWLFQNQRVEGGFSPYPTTIEPSGTLATADAITAITLKVGTNLQSLSGFLHQQQVVDALGSRKTLYERLVDAIAYLANVHNALYPDGGFPPVGDIFYLREASFADATADAILALLSSWEFLRATARPAPVPEDFNALKDANALIETIEKRVIAAVEWIYEHRKEHKQGIYWTTSGYHIDTPGRVFPTWLCCLALDVYLIRVNSGFPTSGKLSLEELVRIRDGSVKWLLHMISNEGFLPFSTAAPEEASFTNTSAVLRMLCAMSEHPTLINQRKLIQDKMEIAASWIAQNLDAARGTESDDIDLNPVRPYAPWIITRYQATYAKLQPALWAFMVYYGEEALKNKAFQKGVEDLLLEIRDNPFYCLEERMGKVQPATSATATAIMFLRDLLERLHCDPFK